jgi:hypothetical protein
MREDPKEKADFADCLLDTTNRFGGCNETVTFDQAASKLEDFQVHEHFPCNRQHDSRETGEMGEMGGKSRRDRGAAAVRTCGYSLLG